MGKGRIAIVDHVGLKAGMECYDLELYHALKSAGCSPVVYSNFSVKEEEIIPVFKFRVKENVYSLLRLISIYGRIAIDLNSRVVDFCILHCFRLGFWEWRLLRKLAKANAKIFLIVHDPESLISNGSSNKWRDRMFELAEKIIVHNRFSNQELNNSISDRLKEKVAIIPHGNFISEASQESDIEKFREENHFTGRKYLLFFGQIKESKGLDLLLEAFAGTDEDVSLIIAGRLRKHSFERYNQIIEKNNLKGRVKLFIGYITPEMRNHLFRLADAIVLPYRKVYQSGVLLMAMSFGKAVIASDLPPNKEIIADKQNGFLFKTGSTIDLVRVINEVVNNDSLREEVANAGFKMVEEKLNWDAIAIEWIKLFQS